MKKRFLFIAVLFLSGHGLVRAQEITISTLFSPSSYNKFKNNIGYEIGYYQLLNLKSKLGLSFAQSFYNSDYNYSFFSSTDGRNYNRVVEPANQRIVLSADISFAVLKKEKSSFFIGPSFGINYFKIKEFVNQRIVGENEYNEFNTQYWENNKIGIGVLLAYEHSVFSDAVSVFVSTTPEMIFLSNPWAVGSNNPSGMFVLNLNLGLKFNLINN